MKIRKAKKSDLELLNKKLFVKSMPNLHEEKLYEQEKGVGFWLIAWEKKIPVGHIQLKIKKLKKRGCTHIESLGVGEKYRKKGIATKLMNFSEVLAKKKGFDNLGLAVEKDNKFLINLYVKKGYEDWKKGIMTESWKEKRGGKIKKISEKCKYLIKKLK